MRFAVCKYSDISEGGMKVTIPEPLKSGSLVNLRSEEMNVSISATVRHCERRGVVYVAGLEFTSKVDLPAALRQ